MIKYLLSLGSKTLDPLESDCSSAVGCSLLLFFPPSLFLFLAFCARKKSRASSEVNSEGAEALTVHFVHRSQTCRLFFILNCHCRDRQATYVALKYIWLSFSIHKS